MATSEDQQGRVARAEARFKLAQKHERDKEQAMAEIAAASRAVDEKTARLKALRLAKEQADAEAAAAAAPPPKKVARKKSGSAPR